MKIMKIMKKYSWILVLTLLMNSCYTSTSQQSAGTFTGAMIGSSVGSLFGGLIDGPRGDWWGSAIGTIAGAAIGNAINAPKNKDRTTVDRYSRGTDSQNYSDAPSVPQNYNDIPTSPQHYRDRPSSPQHYRDTPSSQQTCNDTAVPDAYAALPQEDGQINLMQQLQVKNIKFVDDNHDLKMNPQEHCQLIFDIVNTGMQPAVNVIPMVTANAQKKHIYMSQPVKIDGIGAGESVRYTLSLYSDRGLKTGSVGFNIYLSVNGQQQLAGTFSLPCEN